MARLPIAALVVVGPERADGKVDRANGALDAIAGRPMLEWVVDAVVGASVRRVAIVGPTLDGADIGQITSRTDHALVDHVPTSGFDVVETIAWAIERVTPTGANELQRLLVVRGDVPQLTSADLRTLIAAHDRHDAAATVLPASGGASAAAVEPVISFDEVGDIEAILEPLTDPGGVAAMCLSPDILVPALRRVTPPGWPHDLLLGDAVSAIESTGHAVVRVDAEPLARADLPARRAAVEVVLRERIIEHWLDRGVLIPDPRQVMIDAGVELGSGVELLPGSVLQGSTTVGDGSVIGPNTHLVDASIGTDVHAPSVSVQGVEIPAHARLRPFSVHG